jgi:hypothetical protein
MPSDRNTGSTTDSVIPAKAGIHCHRIASRCSGRTRPLAGWTPTYVPGRSHIFSCSAAKSRRVRSRRRFPAILIQRCPARGTAVPVRRQLAWCRASPFEGRPCRPPEDIWMRLMLRCERTQIGCCRFGREISPISGTPEIGARASKHRSPKALVLRGPASPASTGLSTILALRCEGESPSLEGPGRDPRPSRLPRPIPTSECLIRSARPGSHLRMRIAGRAHRSLANPGT